MLTATRNRSIINTSTDDARIAGKLLILNGFAMTRRLKRPARAAIQQLAALGRQTTLLGLRLP
jgi:hypothetical protein